MQAVVPNVYSLTCVSHPMKKMFLQIVYCETSSVTHIE